MAGAPRFTVFHRRLLDMSVAASIPVFLECFAAAFIAANGSTSLRAGIAKQQKQAPSAAHRHSGRRVIAGTPATDADATPDSADVLAENAEGVQDLSAPIVSVASERAAASIGPRLPQKVIAPRRPDAIERGIARLGRLRWWPWVRAVGVARISRLAVVSRGFRSLPAFPRKRRGC